MLNNTYRYTRVYLVTGYTDLRKGVDNLAAMIKHSFELDPFEKDVLFLFCGRRSDRINTWSFSHS